MIKKETLEITGMSCAACAAKIEKKLNKLEGVKQGNVNLAMERAVVEFDDSVLDRQKIAEVVKNLGYDVKEEAIDNKNKVSLTISGMSCAACAAKIEKKLNKLEGVAQAAVNLAAEKAVVDYDSTKNKTCGTDSSRRSLGLPGSAG
jgi:Cu+-exporting ATPase